MLGRVWDLIWRDVQCTLGGWGRLLIISSNQDVTSFKMTASRSPLAIQISSETPISHALK